jgi:predicted metal-dependent hydrolase
MVDEAPMSPYLVEGIRLFNQGDYFMCHETLEEHWVEAPKEDRDFLQGLIHVAVGLLHHGRGNAKGALLQFSKATKRLEAYPASYQGVDVAAVRHFLSQAKESVESGERLEPPTLIKGDEAV